MGQIPAGHAIAVQLPEGRAIRVINTHGTQVVDTWCLARADTGEYLSVEHTRRMLCRLYPTEGDRLFSNRRNPLLSLERDTSRCRHDMLLACCDAWLYRFHGCADGHANCRDNFFSALRVLGVEPEGVPNPINFWMNVAVENNVRVTLKEPESEPGDHLVLRALADVFVIFSACPMDITPVNGGGIPQSVEFELEDAVSAL